MSYGASWRADAPTRIATIAAGYADGFSARAGRARAVELCGRVVPVVGRVAMDMIMVAIDDDHRVELGDTATLWGGAVSLDQQAEWAGTICLRAAHRPRAPPPALLPHLMRRAAIIVLDGLGIGPAPDADRYGDAGSDTLGNLARAVGGLELPNLERLGLGCCAELPGVRASRSPRPRTASPSRRAPARTARPATGSCAASCWPQPFPTYPAGFPAADHRRVCPPDRPRRARQQAGLGHRDPRRAGRRLTAAPATGSSTPRPTASSRWRRTRRPCRWRSCIGPARSRGSCSSLRTVSPG